MSDSDSSSDLDEDPEKAERRKRAIQLLAQAFNKPKEGAPAPVNADADDEVRFLEHLQKLPPGEVARSVTDRLSVLAVTRGGVRLQAKKQPEPSAAPPTASSAAVDREGTAPVAPDLEPDPEPELLRKVLTQLSEGDTSGVSARVLEPEYRRLALSLAVLLSSRRAARSGPMALDSHGL